MSRSNKYLLDLERDFTIAECHLHLIGKRRGILGHPKCFYDTMLNLNEGAVRKMNFTDEYDPFGLIGRCFIDLFTSDNFINAKGYEKKSLLILWRSRKCNDGDGSLIKHV